MRMLMIKNGKDGSGIFNKGRAMPRAESYNANEPPSGSPGEFTFSRKKARWIPAQAGRASPSVRHRTAVAFIVFPLTDRGVAPAIVIQCPSNCPAEKTRAARRERPSSLEA